MNEQQADELLTCMHELIGELRDLRAAVEELTAPTSADTNVMRMPLSEQLKIATRVAEARRR